MKLYIILAVVAVCLVAGVEQAYSRGTYSCGFVETVEGAEYGHVATHWRVGDRCHPISDPALYVCIEDGRVAKARAEQYPGDHGMHVVYSGSDYGADGYTARDTARCEPTEHPRIPEPRSSVAASRSSVATPKPEPLPAVWECITPWGGSSFRTMEADYQHEYDCTRLQ